MPRTICRHCHHPEEVHNVHGTGECGCGCIKLVPVDRERREAGKRQWLVEVRLFVKNRWIECGEQRVRSRGAANAAAIAIREARRQHLRPRTRVARISVTVMPT